jgi:hypothetical protein
MSHSATFSKALFLQCKEKNVYQIARLPNDPRATSCGEHCQPALALACIRRDPRAADRAGGL